VVFFVVIVVIVFVVELVTWDHLLNKKGKRLHPGKVPWERHVYRTVVPSSTRTPNVQNDKTPEE
jgi:hypothetical protein